jgi:hypothetical protein
MRFILRTKSAPFIASCSWRFNKGTAHVVEARGRCSGICWANNALHQQFIARNEWFLLDRNNVITISLSAAQGATLEMLCIEKQWAFYDPEKMLLQRPLFI